MKTAYEFFAFVSNFKMFFNKGIFVKNNIETTILSITTFDQPEESTDFFKWDRKLNIYMNLKHL